MLTYTINFKWRRLNNEELSVLLTQYCAGDKIQKDEMGWVCVWVRREGGVWGLGGGTGGKETTGET